VGEKNIVIVGAGLSGLCCARTIQRAGGNAVIYEASDGVGGRVRTDRHEGFLLDRGFQVLFPSYPAIRQEIKLDDLKPHAFDPGAIVCHEDRRYPIADPLRKPSLALASAAAPLFRFKDKLLVAKLTAKIASMSVEQIFRMTDKPMGVYLRQFGFSEPFLDRFMRPFFAGIFLEREMATSVRMFAFVYKMLSQGQTALPANGMGAIPAQIAADLHPNTLHLNSPVRELTRSGERVTGIRLEDGTVINADCVIIATPADTAAQLTGLPIPVRWRTSLTAYFALSESLPSGKMLMLFPKSDSFVNDAAVVSHVAPHYAPPGQHLLSTTILGDPDIYTDAEIALLVRQQLSPYFPKAKPEEWRLLRVYRNRWAQFAQPAGVWSSLPAARTGIPGLILAGEITQSSSLHGALSAGQRAAGLALSVRSE
jgi:phytoene dehydrogenase-like protein